jgi:hypothetical protein
MAVATAFAAAGGLLRLGSLAVDAHNTFSEGGTLDVLGQQESLRLSALSAESREIGMALQRRSEERIAQTAQRVSAINANAAALGVVGGASVQAATSSVGARAAQEQADDIGAARRVLENISIQRKETQKAARAQRRQARTDVFANVLGQAGSLAQTGERIFRAEGE